MLFKNQYKYPDMGYKFNPFKGLTVDEFIEWFPPGNFIDDLLDSDFDVLQIVAGSGFGKTSTLRQIESFYKNGGQVCIYHYIRNRADLAEILSPGAVIILDEAQRVERRGFMSFWNEVQKENCKIILGSHMDHESWFNKETGLKTVYLSRFFRKRLPGIIQKRLEMAAIDQPKHTFTREALEKMTEISEGSMERARSIGYELFLDSVLPKKIPAEYIEKASEIVLTRTERVYDAGQLSV